MCILSTFCSKLTVRFSCVLSKSIVRLNLGSYKFKNLKYYQGTTNCPWFFVLSLPQTTLHTHFPHEYLYLNNAILMRLHQYLVNLKQATGMSTLFHTTKLRGNYLLNAIGVKKLVRDVADCCSTNMYKQKNLVLVHYFSSLP